MLSFLNLVGVLVTATALGGLEPWSPWQFIGMYGAIETASGLANVISPNLWRLPIAEMQTKERSGVKLAASALLLPHWGGLARAVAGLVCMAVAAWQEGIGPASFSLVLFVLALAWWILALSAVLARAGVSRPEVDVVQFIVRWGNREKELAPISIGASMLQFLLGIVTIPAVKLFSPSVMYQPEIAASGAAVLGADQANPRPTSSARLARWTGAAYRTYARKMISRMIRMRRRAPPPMYIHSLLSREYREVRGYPPSRESQHRCGS